MKSNPINSIKFFNRNYIVDKKTGCWNWISTIGNKGYGVQSGHRAHRLSWRLHKGEIPKNINVLHKCDNRKCVNPEHLFLGTQKDNMQDCAKKGRISLIGAKIASKTNIGRKASPELCKLRSKNTKAWMNSERSKLAKLKIAKAQNTKRMRKIRRENAIKQWQKVKEMKE